MPRRTKDDIDGLVINLTELTERLEGKDLKKALRRSLMTAANVVGRNVRKAITETKVHNARLIAKTVRVGVSRDLTKFYASVLPRQSIGGRKGGFHLNRQGKWKPVAHWFNIGVSGRKTRKGYNRGSKRGFYFIDKVESQSTQKAIEKLVDAYRKQVYRLVNK